MCPSAEQLLGQLALNDRVVPIAFHIDYFNDPWKDPFSDAKFSRRESQYSVIYDRENKLNNPSYLYLTPLVMIDGRFPMLGTDDAKAGKAMPKAKDAVRRALAEKPGVSLGLTLKTPRQGNERTLEVAVTPLIPELRGRDVLIAVIPFSEIPGPSRDISGPRIYSGMHLVSTRPVVGNWTGNGEQWASRWRTTHHGRRPWGLSMRGWVTGR